MRTFPFVPGVLMLGLTATGLAAAQPAEPAPEPVPAPPAESPAPPAEAAKPPPVRMRIPHLRWVGRKAAVGSPSGLAPSHGKPPPPPPAESAPAAATPVPVVQTMPQYEFGNPNVGLDGHPLAGYHGGMFYLRDRADYFKIFLRSRLHIDSYNYFGPGVSDAALKSTMLLRRVRVELGGELMGHWQWETMFEFGPTGFSNPDGTQETYAAPAGQDPTATSARYAAVQDVKYSARPIHAYVNYRASDLFNVQVGQFNLPFTMENRTGTNTITFMERALPVRAWGVPGVKDMGVRVWGSLDKHVLDYAWAVVQGEGENRPNADNRALTAARVYTRPLAPSGGALEKLQVGASVKYGMHDKNYVAYDYPSMSTQSGYRFWVPTYRDSVGTGRRVHVIPSGAELGVAGELRLPFDRFDLRSELVYLKNNTREGVDGFQSEYTERFGTIKGYSYYVMLSYWLFGKPGLTGDPGDRKPPRLQLDKPDPGVPPHAVEVALKWEQLNATYESAARGGSPDAKNMDGDIKANVISAGVNYWATRHMRVTVNYMLNMFPDSAPTKASSADGPTWSSSQRALAPGNQLPVGINDDARDTAHTLHEVTARIAVAF